MSVVKMERKMESTFFTKGLESADPELNGYIQKELERQQDQLELIASENIVSRAVLEAQGSILTNKYAEGYSGRRYYGGCEYVDEAETLAIKRVCKLFECQFANVQPHSGSQANQAVFMALLQPGDVILGMDLNAGGHLTHGSHVNQSGKWFEAHFYGVDKQTHFIDMNQVRAQALEHKPKLIIAGGSAYSRKIDFAAFRAIADEVGAYLMVDMAHFSGLVAAKAIPSPLPHAHVVTSTTHKTLRGPRGGIVLTNDADIAKKINSAVFPGLQGGPLMHVVAAKAVAFGEALQQDFKAYINQVMRNAQILGEVMVERGFAVVSGGTDTHLILVDLSAKNVTGDTAETSLEHAGITCNKNGIPFDKHPPRVTSGIRLGTPAITTRGFGDEETRQLGHLIADVLDGLAASPENNSKVEKQVRAQVQELCKRFPIY